MDDFKEVQNNTIIKDEKSKKKIKTSKEIRQELINKIKEMEKKIKEIDLKEAEKKIKPLYNLFLKNAHKLSDDDIKRMVAHYKVKFAEKKEENK